MRSYFLGGDVSKGYCDFTLLDKRKKVVEKNFQLDDCYSGHQALCCFFEKFYSSHKDAVIYAGVESTGGYENNWYQLLWKLQDRFKIQVVRLNPFGIKHHKKASLERIETDKISARKIAEYLIAYPEKIEYNKEDYFAILRRHWKYIRTLKHQKSQLQIILKGHLYVAQPQLLVYCTEGIADWILRLLTKYPTARRLARATVKTLSGIPYVSEERAKELISDAKRSIASKQDSGMERIVKSAVSQILNLKKAIDQQVKLMKSSHDFPEIEILTSFKGISEFSAFGLLLEIGAIERYPTVKKLASFFGIHPRYVESGDGIFEMRMSKQGRKEPRWLLFLAAQSAVVHDDMIRELYEGYLMRKESRMEVLGIIMHKILRIIYGMLKHKTKYEPTVDIANRKKTANKKEAKSSTNSTGPTKSPRSRRYQGYDKNAPISRRQTKKRNRNKEKPKEVTNGIINGYKEKEKGGGAPRKKQPPGESK